MASLINNLTNFADQTTTLQLPDGSSATMELIYNGTTERWIMNLTYGTFAAYGIGVCCYPNLLRQWMNIIPFGIACTTPDQTDPIAVNDFFTGRVSLYILTQTDIASIESTVFGTGSTQV